MIFMKMLLILNSFEVLCDKNPLFKIQSVLSVCKCVCVCVYVCRVFVPRIVILGEVVQELFLYIFTHLCEY